MDRSNRAPLFAIYPRFYTAANSPSCGREMDLDVALERAARYLNQGVIKGLQDRQIRSTRRLKHVSYVLGKIPKIDPPDFVFD